MSPSRATTFPALLAEALRRDAARPLVTFYDDATGERIELSVTTYANWVAKTAGLVQDELEVERGALVLLDLPTHWTGVVWLGALWTGGQTATDDRSLAEQAALVVCGPDRVAEYAPLAGSVPVVAVSLRPLGAPFAEPLPAGVVDYGAVVLAQSDAFLPLDPPAPEDPAWRAADGTTDQGTLLTGESARELANDPWRAEGLGEDGARLLTDVNPCSRAGLATLIAPLACSGGTVWVAHPDESRWQRRYVEERATVQLRDIRAG